MIWFILMLNLAASIYFLVRNRKEKGKALLLFFFFLALPVFGILMYYLPIAAFFFIHKKYVYNVEDLIYAGKDEVYAKRPDIEQELNLIPVNEALAVNDSGEKREFVLNIIKEDMAANYKTILPALGDSDSETSHYAAAAAMEMQRRMRKEIDRLTRLLEAGEPVEQRLLDSLKSYAESGVLTKRDMLFTKRNYISVMKKGILREPALFDNGYYLTMAQYLMEDGQTEAAVLILNERLAEEPAEKLYEKLLEIYHTTGNEEAFVDTVQSMRESRIVLSPEALSRLRFWIQREGMI